MVDEEQWLLWLHLHGVRLPAPQPRQAGDPSFRKHAVCLRCPGTGPAHQHSTTATSPGTRSSGRPLGEAARSCSARRIKIRMRSEAAAAARLREIAGAVERDGLAALDQWSRR